MEEALLLEEGLSVEESAVDTKLIQTYNILFIQSCGDPSVKFQVSLLSANS